MPGLKKDKVIHGEEDDPYFVSDSKRRCAGKCEKILPLSWFYPSERSGETLVTPFCKVCLPEYANSLVEKDKSDASIARINAIRDMGDNLKKILSRPITKDDGPSVVEMATQTIKAIQDPVTKAKGQAAFSEMVAREVGQVYESLNPCVKTRVLRHKWANLIIELQSIVAKVKAEETKVGDLSDDQLAALLEFASKQAVLESPEIRTALLGDPEVRAALLSELGKDVIDIPAIESVDQPGQEVDQQ